MATIGKTLFAHFRQVLHASAQYDQAITVFHRLKKRLEVSNLCSLSWDQTVTFSDLAHGLSRASCCINACMVSNFDQAKARSGRACLPSIGKEGADLSLEGDILADGGSWHTRESSKSIFSTMTTLHVAVNG